MKTPAKLLGGLALGALVMTATALPLGTTYADEPTRPLSSEQTQCYPEDVVLGWCYGFAAMPDPALAADTTISGVQILPEDAWRFDSPYYDDFLADEAARASTRVVGRYDRSLDEEFMSDAPFFHTLNQGKAGRPSSINGFDEVLSEIEDTPVFHLLKQLKAGSPPSINGIRCYPEDNC